MPYLLKPVRFFLAFLAFAGLSYGCKKSIQPLHQSTDSLLISPGTLYILADENLEKVEANKSVTNWSTPVIDGFGSYNSPLDFNAGNIYFGGLDGLAAYNYQTGALNWMGGIPFDPGASTASMYRGAAFQDSLVFYTGPTGVTDGGAQLYGNYQNNGNRLWADLIDSAGNNTSDFNGIPFVSNGNVLTVTRGGDGNLAITAFDASTGNRIWATAENSQLSPQLHVTNNYVYCASGADAFCYSTNDGSLQWQTDMQLPAITNSTSSTYTFVDGNQLIVCRNYGLTVNLIRTINASTGALMSSFEVDFPEAVAFNGYGYSGGVVYTVNTVHSASAVDSLELCAFNLGTNQPTWKYSYFQSSSQSLVVTNNYLIFPTGIADSTTGLNVQSEMVFLTLNGTFVKNVPYAGFSADKFMYVDSSGVLYKQADY